MKRECFMMFLKRINFFVIVSAVLAFTWLSFVSCNNEDNKNNTETEKKPTNQPELMPVNENNPEPFETRSENLNFIFDTNTIGKTTITIKRSEWETLCTNFDKYEKNEEYVHANYAFEREVAGRKENWVFNDVGFRLRGNTSRVRPQKKEGEYQQAHFKVDFEEFLDGVDADGNELERKMAGCMKGVNLKRFKDDKMSVREIYCYNFFRDNGIWTSPRATYTRLEINIIEKNNMTTKIDYGVYAMIENIDKQFLKARTKKENCNFKDNKGNLWKCLWPANLKDTNASFGVEDIKMPPAQSKTYAYDLKTNKESLANATTEFKTFIKELNELTDKTAIKNWYESKMDVDLFIKTYAINVILGMDDDYWRNANNYYFYFDSNGKSYFIPYDYDNSLGTNCFEDTATKNPLNWGNNDEAPLIGKMLKVDEYKEKYKNYLKELTSNESDFITKSKSKITSWQNLIKPYIKSQDIVYNDTSDVFVDTPASWCSNNGKYFLLKGDDNSNYFLAKAKSIRSL